MTAIIIPRRHYTQPQGRVSLRVDSPLVQNPIAVYHAPSNTDVARNIVGRAVGNTLYPAVAGGVALASADNDGYVELSTGPAIGTAPFTMYWAGRLGAYGRPGNVAEGGGLFAQEVTWATPGIMWGDRALNQKFYLIDGWQNYVAGPNMSAGEDVVLVAVRTATHIRLYKNGELGTTTEVAARNHNSSRPFYVSSGQNNTAWNARCSTLSCGILLTAWNDEGVAEFSRNIWQLFSADPLRIYSLPSGAITINSIIASNITQTGARITLGVTR